MAQREWCVIIAGPTAVGKTAIGDALAIKINGEIINSDMGQCYAPLTIGTAKPAWHASVIPHHLFDMVTTPLPLSALALRTAIAQVVTDTVSRGRVPIVVGGSSYYTGALFFPPERHGVSIEARHYDPAIDWWQRLAAIDPERAHAIDPHDTYRIRRALDIWYSTGEKPSSYVPTYAPIAPTILIWVTRDRDELYERINARVTAMIASGWIEEVRGLLGTPWEHFLIAKKFIGYGEVIAYCRGKLSYGEMEATIQTKTRNYAKRQMTFWRMLARKIKAAQYESSYPVKLEEVNLTHEPIDRYIKQLVSVIDHKP